jgi:hypothetical protein
MIASFSMAQLVNAVFVFTLIECLVLVAYHRSTGKGVAPRDFLANMVSGLCLMLALRSLAVDAGAAWVAVCLAAAGAAHGVDMLMRWKRSTRNAGSSSRATA